MNKISYSKNIWDYAYEADNNKKFNPMPYKIILSLNDENETTLEYGIIGWLYSDVDRSLSLDYDVEGNTNEFIDYVCGKFGIKIPNSNIITEEYEEYELFNFLIQGYGLENGLNDLIQFFMYSFYDSSTKTVEILKKYNFRIEYA